MAMLWLKWAVTLAVMAVAVGTASGAHRSAPAPVAPVVAAPAPQPTISPECMDAVLNMSDCLPYVESGSTTKHPDKACCPELDGLLQSNPVCLCQLLAGGGESYGVSVDYKRAMALPGVCGLNAPPLSACAGLSDLLTQKWNICSFWSSSWAFFGAINRRPSIRYWTTNACEHAVYITVQVGRLLRPLHRRWPRRLRRRDDGRDALDRRELFGSVAFVPSPTRTAR